MVQQIRTNVMSRGYAAQPFALRGLVTIAAAVSANLALRYAAGLALPIDAAFEPLQYAAIALFTAVGVLGAVLTYGLLQRLVQRPRGTFRIVAAVVLLASFVPDFMLGATAANLALLLLLHSLPAAISMWLLTSSAPRTASN